MSGKITNLILVFVMLSVPVAAVKFSSQVTVQNGEVHTSSASTVSNGEIHTSSASTVSNGEIHTSSESTIYKGSIYTFILSENPAIGKWKVTYSSGLTLQSDTSVPSSTGSEVKRELKFLANQKGKHTITAEYHKSGEEKSTQTSNVVLDVI